MAKSRVLTEFWQFLKQEKKYWLMPIVVVFVLFGNSQHLELHPWQAADEMTVRVPFKWDLNAWYRMKLHVVNRTDGTTLVQGKVWPTGQPEPAAWTIQKTDTIPHRKGAPGLCGDGISDIHFDNVRVYKNQ